VDAYETCVDSIVQPVITSYGTYGMGADLTSVAWPLLQQVFTGGDPTADRYFDRPPSLRIDSVHQIPKDFLQQHPVELLVLGNMTQHDYQRWVNLIPGQTNLGTPRIVIEFWEPWHISRNTDRPMAKLTITRWNTLGYVLTCISANSTQVGGVADRKWLICARTLRSTKNGIDWPELPHEIARPMANCL
jgi:hypothetical protein